MKLESLVTADQLRCGEYVPGPCTHTARHVTKAWCTRSRWPNRKEGGAEGVPGDWDEVVTR